MHRTVFDKVFLGSCYGGLQAFASTQDAFAVVALLRSETLAILAFRTACVVAKSLVLHTNSSCII